MFSAKTIDKLSALILLFFLTVPFYFLFPISFNITFASRLVFDTSLTLFPNTVLPTNIWAVTIASIMSPEPFPSFSFPISALHWNHHIAEKWPIYSNRGEICFGIPVVLSQRILISFVEFFAATIISSQRLSFTVLPRKFSSDTLALRQELRLKSLWSSERSE